MRYLSFDMIISPVDKNYGICYIAANTEWDSLSGMTMPVVSYERPMRNPLHMFVLNANKSEILHGLKICHNSWQLLSPNLLLRLIVKLIFSLVLLVSLQRSPGHTACNFAHCYCLGLNLK